MLSVQNADSRLAKNVYLLISVLIMFTSMGALMTIGLETIMWALFYVLVVIWFFADTEQFLRAISDAWILLLFPALAIVSTFWSLDPLHTLRISIFLLLTTLVGLWIATYLDFRQIALSVALAGSLAVLLSLLNARLNVVPAHSSYGEFFIGIFNHKNQLGRAIVLTAWALWVIGLDSLKRALVAIPLILVLLMVLPSASSATSLVSFLILLILMPLTAVLLRQNQEGRLLGALLLPALFMFAVFLVLALDLRAIDAFLSSIGKDSTLTGRTDIWGAGMAVFEGNVLAGIGFDAFWSEHAGPLVREIWSRFGQIESFHNTLIHVTVSLGLLGMLSLLLYYASYISRLLGGWRFRSVATNVGGLYLFTYLVFFGMVETSGFTENDIVHLLFVAVWLSLGRESARPA